MIKKKKKGGREKETHTVQEEKEVENDGIFIKITREYSKSV